MRTEEAWDELEAQVEAHGPEAVRFYLDTDTTLRPGRHFLEIQNVQYTDDEIQVTVG